jgi:hypothetical protein
MRCLQYFRFNETLNDKLGNDKLLLFICLHGLNILFIFRLCILVLLRTHRLVFLFYVI